MPLLPKGNKLDFDPDVITNAGRTLSLVQLENMKNPVLDPDFQVLSTLEAQKKLDDSMYDFEEMAGSYHNLVQRIMLALTNIAPKVDTRMFPDRIGSRRSSVNTDDEIDLANRLIQGRGRKGRKGRMFGGAEPTDVFDWEQNRLMRPRFTQEHARSGLNTVATPSVNRNEGQQFTRSAYQDVPATLEPSLDRPAVLTTTSQTIPDLLYQLIQLTRRMDMFLNSKIKPATMKLSQVDISKLQDIFQMVTDSYNDIRFPQSRKVGTKKDPFTKAHRYTTDYANLPDTAFDSVEYGLMYEFDYGYEIFSNWNEERRKLLLDLLVVINSWKQNSPAGAATEFDEKVENEYEDTAYRLGSQIENIRSGAGRKKSTKKMGGGRNFYGQVINDSRDIPTIYGHLQNCPTKYLL